MIKLIVFDLDGVLIDARELHYEALNMALHDVGEQYVINRTEHLSTYDGLPTTRKLNMLTEKKGLSKTVHDSVWKGKQHHTINIIKQDMNEDAHKIMMLKRLRDNGYKIAVASNSITQTMKMMLLKNGLLEYIDFYLSNEDVKRCKPAAEIYMQCMIKAGVDPHETLIVEDSHVGRQAAINSGAHLCPVENSDGTKYGHIINHIRKAEKKNKVMATPKWQGGKMNILIPMAGEGSRFSKAGYTFPKPLIEIDGKPMIQLVVENLNIDANYIFIIRKEHDDQYHIRSMLERIVPNCTVVEVDNLTEGAACTTMLAKHFIDNDEHLLIANSDQFVEWESNEFMYSMVADGVDAGILTFKSTHPKWSYAKLDDLGLVSEVAEKNPISDNATVGIYYWKHGKDYVAAVERMIKRGDRHNNEFYVCPAFNHTSEDGVGQNPDFKTKIFDVPKMWGLGTPEDLELFIKKGPLK